MEHTITLITREDPAPESTGTIGLLFEAPADHPIASQARRLVSLETLVGDPEAVKVTAYELCQRLLIGEPVHRGMQQFGVFEEDIIGEFAQILHAIHLHRYLAKEGFRACLFSRDCKWSRRLVRLGKLEGGSKTTIRVGAGPRRKFWGVHLGRSLNRVKTAGISATALRYELLLALRRFDPYRRLNSLAFWRRRERSWQGGAWFYTTANTYTQIGLLYETCVSKKFQFLVEDWETGGVPLRRNNRSGWSLYDFLRPEHRPTTDEIATTRDSIITHIRNVPMEGDAWLARELLLEGAWFAEFLGRRLGISLLHTSLLGEFLDQVRPESIWVGNPGWERHLLVQAKRRSIPTNVLQHGILGDFCQFSDPPVDRYVVRGKFWFEFLSARARSRALILNPPEPVIPTRAPVRGGHVLFLTGFSELEFWHVNEISQLLEILLRTTTTAKRKLVIRVHPRERVQTYQLLVNRTMIQAAVSEALVEFSQGGSLDTLIDGSCAVVTHFSTVFLDCLRRQVPLIGFGWHHFSIKRPIEPTGVFHLARDLGHLLHLLQRALAGELPAFGGDIRDFLAHTSEAEWLRIYSPRPSLDVGAGQGPDTERSPGGAEAL